MGSFFRRERLREYWMLSACNADVLVMSRRGINFGLTVELSVKKKTKKQKNRRRLKSRNGNQRFSYRLDWLG